MNLRKAALINASGKYSKIILTIIVNAILARILSAKDYGIVAVVTVFSTFFSTFSDMGLGTAVVQNKELTKDDLNNIFSFSIYVSLALAILFNLLAYPISIFYNGKVYISLVRILSISLFFDALNMVPNGILNRNKKFKTLAIRTVVVYFISALITVFLALNNFKYYALVIQAVLTSFFTFVWNMATTGITLKLRFNIQSVKQVFGYASFQMGFNIIDYFSKNLDNLLVGKFFGSTSLGYYNKAYLLMTYPVNNLTGVVSPVLHPILSDFQNQKEIIYKKYMKVFKLIYWAGLYVAPICYIAGYEIINIMYGPNWNQSIKCFQYLSFAIMAQMLSSSMYGIFQALGDTNLLFLGGIINFSIIASAILISVVIGGSMYTVSLAIAIAYNFSFIILLILLMKFGFHNSIFGLVKELKYEIIFTLFMIIMCKLYNFQIKNVFLSLACKIIYISVVFFVSYFAQGKLKEKEKSNGR
ncbi:lipopolysaccharide biosynthesis protein [Limosilactobacillus mucosae]|uniref:lipopolysaccharide biosynthesis protein n=1 Tax=Limosilactobacillus mucosae TaxID=97478 RepID=UPI003EBA6A29